MSSFSSETLHPRARSAPFPSPFVSPLTRVAADQRADGNRHHLFNRTVGPVRWDLVRSVGLGAQSVRVGTLRPRASPPRRKRLSPPPTKAMSGHARGPGPLAGTGPCTVVDRICDQRARRLATTRPTPATPSRPTSAMATPVFAPVLASLLPSVLVPPAGWDCSTVGCGCSAVGCGCSTVGWGCSGVGWGCSGAGSSGKSHVEDAEVSDGGF